MVLISAQSASTIAFMLVDFSWQHSALGQPPAHHQSTVKEYPDPALQKVFEELTPITHLGDPDRWEPAYSVPPPISSPKVIKTEK